MDTLPTHVQIAIIGSGPGGLSAAAHAAKLGVSHCLFEAQNHLSHTIYCYQKGKHVMAEPGILPLRSEVKFDAAKREQLLQWCDEAAKTLNINVQYQAEIKKIQKNIDNIFELKTHDGQTFTADNVVLGIGLQGNLRKLGVAGEDLPFVQYQLNDPDEYKNEDILIVGAGDAAIENAIALANNNRVTIINRRDEFSRAKDGNNNAILAAIEKGILQCKYNTDLVRAEYFDANDPKSGRLVVSTPNGEETLKANRIIARLGAIPPRQFVESCGIVFPSKDPNAVPAISPKYESNVPGLYIVGALGGYPLIKQAMNQGYEVIEFILGRPCEPADENLLKNKLKILPNFKTVDLSLDFLQANVPMLAHLTRLQLREFLLDSQILIPKPGSVIFARDEFSTEVYNIVQGEVLIQIDKNNPKKTVSVGAGNFFGEMSLISGRRRSATIQAGKNCVLVQTPRRSMLKLMQSVDAVRKTIDEAFLTRIIEAQIAPGVPIAQLTDVIKTAKMARFKANQVLFNEGDDGDCLHLIRRGSVTVSRTIAGQDLVLAYVPAGRYVGEMALISEGKRTATVKAAVAVETIRLDGIAFKQLMANNASVKERIEAIYASRLAQNVQLPGDDDDGANVVKFMMKAGLGEATDVLIIDEHLCVRCDQCEKACAATHGNVSRLNREAGPSYANLHVPTSCRHCEHPHCMKDCPPDAIRRAPNGEVYIESSCIGCGNCERNCPYGVIQMGLESKKSPSLLSWLLFGGREPGLDHPDAHKKDAIKKAVKCDMCKGQHGGPACVRACPTGAAVRANPEDLIKLIGNKQ